ncbi:hypothetical protein SAMN04489722_102558 [Algibacter lectus]|uniref:hypothetical protein n=1 Tax=Algibacter lectus TaxID=221126 RepID=UPI0008F30540|nr:hypothetical protein [Algibacter lectus]SFC49830.1 hypothetical protein SAMN04489722_102558 [Algibacter lectus]
MKSLQIIIVLSAFITLTSFKTKAAFQPRTNHTITSINQNQDDKDFIGKWIQNSYSPAAKKYRASSILEIDFKKDYTAHFLISKGDEIKTIIGAWSTRETENSIKIMGPNANLENGVILEYLRNGKDLSVIHLSRSIKAGKVLLKTGDVIFERTSK